MNGPAIDTRLASPSRRAIHDPGFLASPPVSSVRVSPIKGITPSIGTGKLLVDEPPIPTAPRTKSDTPILLSKLPRAPHCH